MDRTIEHEPWAGSQAPVAASWRMRWQWPTFAAGLLALTAALAFPPARLPTPEESLRQQVAEAIDQLDRGEVATTRPRLNALAQAVEAYPAVAGDVHLALGMAKLAPMASDVPTRSELLGARKHLREANALGVAPALVPRLNYQVQRIALLLDATDDQAYAGLQEAIGESTADTLDGLDLLAKVQEARGLYDQAVRTTERLLAQPTLANPNPIRLRRALLLLRLERYAEARPVLERIPSSSPEYAQAQKALAESHYRVDQWEQAARHWEACLQLEGLAAADRGPILLELADCYGRLDRRGDAVKTWTVLTRDYANTPEALPARLHLVEHYLRAGDEDSFTATLVHALDGLTPAFQNPHVDLATLRHGMLAAWMHCMSQGRLALALDVAQRYAPVASPGEADQLTGQVHLEAAKLIKQVAADDGSGLAKARQCRIDGAAAFVRAADAKTDATDQANLLWAAADCYLQSQAYDQAAPILERYFALNVATPHRLDARLGLGEAYQALKRTDQAAQVLKELADQPGPQQNRASYLLALALLDQNNVAEAEVLLRGILSAPAESVTSDTVSLALGGLAHLLYRQERYLDAAKALEQNQSRSLADATNPQHCYWLAKAYEHAARQELGNVAKADTQEAKDFYAKVRREYLESAVRQYQHLLTTLTAPHVPGVAAVQDAILLAEGRLGLGECLWRLERHDEALSALGDVVADEATHALALRALLVIARIHLTKKRPEDARAAVATARERFGKLGEAEIETARLRPEWESWLVSLEAAVLKPPPPPE